MTCMRSTFLAALPAVRILFASPDTGRRWKEESALPGLSVGGLAGHLCRTILVTDTYLGQPEPVGGNLITAVAYYCHALDPNPESEINRSIRTRGEEHGAAGQAALLIAFDGAAARLSERLPREPAERAVQVIGGLTLSLDEYLRTRLVELSVHADDLAVSIGDEVSFPVETWSEAIGMLVDLARFRHGDVAVIRALARRERVADTVFPVL